MKNRIKLLAICGTLLLGIGWVGFVLFAAKRKSVNGLPQAVSPNTVIRFFYEPPESYEHPALIFRVVPVGDKRLGTAPIANLGGRTPYISIIEMQALVEALSDSGIAWHQSAKNRTVAPVLSDETADDMEISIFSSGRPIDGYVKISDMCGVLSKLDKTLSQPRALWEFLLFRKQYGCEVHNFDRNAYPQHDGG